MYIYTVTLARLAAAGSLVKSALRGFTAAVEVGYKNAITNRYCLHNIVVRRIRKFSNHLSSHVHLNVSLAPTGQIFLKFAI